ncbi:hypothetical protein GGU10DRAFT_383349 [Lentinula aff. detonsa]|uniref:Uncharacterized protein n=1 Tax=Lentinula aff. detonsa TaxID=2804958 RepID=A0AA38U039_9AGAR|nr:hypothetical protein GGU10DRAFT_383349 [Lentinula aff. detonsa]
MTSTPNFTTPLIGPVFERKPTSSKPLSSGQSRFASALNTTSGFPPVQHRSQKGSAFSRNLEHGKRTPALSANRSTQVPPIAPNTAPVTGIAGPGPSTIQIQNQKQNSTSSADDWRSKISAENEARVQVMTEEERAAETREVLERFGPGVGEILRRARETRQRNKDTKTTSLEEVPFTSEREPLTSPTSIPGSPLVSSLSRSSSRAGTRPNSPSRASRKLRFAELGPDQVYVYPSAPSSPKKILALPPPDGDSNTMSIGTFKGKMKPIDVVGSEPKDVSIEEGTAEHIRQKYFPSAPANNPDLAWMSTSAEPPPLEQMQTSGLRFDLSGTPIPSHKILSLPTHLGLHHHSEGTRAGYTLDDIFLLTRSTVRAQRAAMLELLGGVIRWLRTGGTKEDADIEAARTSLLASASPQSEDHKVSPLLKRVLFTGLEALPERGAVGIRALDVVWECIAVPQNIADNFGDLEFELGGMEEEYAEERALIAVLPLADVLPQFLNILLNPPDNNLGDEHSSKATMVEQDGYQYQSLNATPAQQQILSILNRLARYSNSYAESVLQEKGLIEGLLKYFIISPASTSGYHTPDLSAIRLLSILASSSRKNAEVLCQKIGVGDVLLRFIVLTMNENVLIEIMLFYTILARYGMYSHVAADAKEVWWKIGDHVSALSSSNSRRNTRLIRAYAGLIESWLVCATDPHRTTPSHELLWSQVKGWEWGPGLANMLVKLSSVAADEIDSRETDARINVNYMSTSASLWRSLGAYLEGVKVNGVRGGEEERIEVALILKGVFHSGTLRMIRNSIEALKTQLTTMVMDAEITLAALREVASLASILSSAIRLWLGFCPSDPSSEGSPPFELPFTEISDLCALLVGHNLWHRQNHHPLLVRPLSTFLTFFLQLSPRLPGSHTDLWLAQAFGIVKTLRRGDEEYALQIISRILDLLTPDWAAQRGHVGAPTVVWEEKGGLKSVLGPFLRYECHPQRDPYSYIAPLYSSPKSIGICTTLRVPSVVADHRRGGNTEWRPQGLPLLSDWTLSPLNHLLRSGSDHTIFKQSGTLPDTWDASETEIVRAALALARVEREVFTRFAPSMMSVVGQKAEEVVLGCMKVFMLEHDVGPENNKAQLEGQGSLQEVFRDDVVAQQMHELLEPYTVKASSMPVLISTSSPTSLEIAALPLLGTSVPFYQFYTDFLSLYDSISFSHPIFSRLLLPPTSMMYAPDYRKLLWSDYSHVLRGIRIDVDDVIVGAGGIWEWLYPVETAPEVLGAYLHALVRYGEGLQGFIRLLAVHHVAANIWPDFRIGVNPEEAMAIVDDERRSKLLRTVIEQGGMQAVREVLRYRQSPQSHRVLRFPQCFEEVDESCKKRRCKIIENWGGHALLERVSGVFEERSNMGESM